LRQDFEALKSASARVAELEAEISLFKKKEAKSRKKSEDENSELRQQITKLEEQIAEMDRDMAAYREEKKKNTELAQKAIQNALSGNTIEYEGKLSTATMAVVSIVDKTSSLSPPDSDMLDTIILSLRRVLKSSLNDRDKLSWGLSTIIGYYRNIENTEAVKNVPDKEIAMRLDTPEEGLGALSVHIHRISALAADFYVALLKAFQKGSASIVQVVLTKQKPTEYISTFQELFAVMKEHRFDKQLMTHCILGFNYQADAQVFNSLIKRTDLYTGTNGFAFKMAVSQTQSAVINTIGKAEKDYQSVVSKQMPYMKEVSNLLLMDKHNLEEHHEQTFDLLNVTQIVHFLSHFKPDETAPDKIDAKTMEKFQELSSAESLPLELDPVAITVNLLE